MLISIFILHRWKLSEKSRSLFCSSQLLIDDLIACDSRWSIKQGYNISLLSLEQALFHGWLSIQTGLSEVLFPYNDKGQDNTNLVP